MDERVAELVLRAVEQVPAGRVVSYGDIAGLVGCGPRQVGAVLRAYGSGVAWWRVVTHAGDMVCRHQDEAHVHWSREGILWKPNGKGCRIGEYRADLARLADDWERATADVPTS